MQAWSGWRMSTVAAPTGKIQHDGASYDWTLRRNTAIVLARWPYAPARSAACSGLRTGWRAALSWPAALMAAAGASDIRRFHLPLPFTLAGIVIALAGAYLSHMPTYILLLHWVWAALSILLHILGIAWVDPAWRSYCHVVDRTVAPYNGLLAVVAGDLANIILARIKGLRGKKVAAAGAWLVCAAVLMACPPTLPGSCLVPQP